MTGGVVLEWDYEHYPSDEIRSLRCRDILVDLDAERLSLDHHARDSRPVHHRMFEGMTPPGHEYFAGHYRGENFPGLLNYNVGVLSDRRVGTPAADVQTELQRFEVLVEQVILFLSRLPSELEPMHLIQVVGQACALLVEFLRVHPYANGNGHIGRFIVWAVLVAAGVRPRQWPLNDKVPYPYGELLSRYRDGDRMPLILFVLRHV